MKVWIIWTIILIGLTVLQGIHSPKWLPVMFINIVWCIFMIIKTRKENQ